MELSPKQRAYFLLGIILFFVLFIILWVSFINRGTLSVSGEAPFNIEFIGAPSLSCEVSPCENKMFPGTYRAIVKKDGFYEKDESITIKRFNKTNIILSLKRIPEISSLGKYILPSVPLRKFDFPANTETVRLDYPKDLSYDIFPPTFDELNFSPNGNSVLIYTKSSVFLFLNKATTLKKLSTQKIKDFVWFPDGKGMAYFSENPEDKYQTLNVYFFEKDSPEICCFFQNKIDNPILKISQDSKYALLHDSKNSSLYFIDFLQKSRKKISFSEKINDMLFSPDSNSVLIQTFLNRGRIPSLYILDLKTEKFKKLNIQSTIKNTVFFDDSHLISTVSQSSSSLQLGGAGPQMIVSMPNNNENDDKKMLVNFDISKNSSTLIINSNSEFSINPERIDLSDDKKTIYFLQEQKLYKVEI